MRRMFKYQCLSGHPGHHGGGAGHLADFCAEIGDVTRSTARHLCSWAG